MVVAKSDLTVLFSHSIPSEAERITLITSVEVSGE